MPFKLLPHTADLDILVSSGSVEGLFIESVNAMFSMLGPLKERGISDSAVQVRRYTFSSKDQTALLVDFLNELLSSAYINKKEYKIASIKLDNGSIDAQVEGRDVSGFRNEIKAATYHGAEIKKTERGFEVELIFDI